MDQYDIRLRGLTSKGKQLVRDYGPIWRVVNTNGPNVVVASPAREPTYWRILMETGDPNFEVERLDAPQVLLGRCSGVAPEPPLASTDG